MTDAAIATRPETLPAPMDPQALITKAIEAGASIDTMERLFALAKEIRAERAKEAYNGAMAEFQRLCPPIKKTKTANVRPNFSYTYAPLDEVTGVVEPVMGPLGLSVSWRSRAEGDKVIVWCRISHRLGHHEESGEIPMPLATGDSGATPPQRVGIALTYGRRYALLGILGVAPEDDDQDGDTKEKAPTSAQPSGGQTAHGQELEALITEPQLKRLSAIASGKKWTDEQIHEIVAGYGYASRKDILVKDYDQICEKLKQNPPGKAA